ncbi:S8 family serine peptidase [Kribbella sp. NBC_01245]|uniref:S8 family serine peptidase n=1 Tax=Kribbella sp. NBC_01245 TaxID=2903578 RepID=UPI002E2AE6D0|nr:S8 family serine peptidase [Kribbella sp. NBC_01245]
MFVRLTVPVALVAAFITSLTLPPATAAPSSREPVPPLAQLPVARPAPGPKLAPKFAPGTVLVKFRAGTATRDRVLARNSARVVGSLPGGFVEVKVKGAPEAAAAVLRRDPSVEVAVLDYIRHAAVTPDDPFYKGGYQTYLDLMRLPSAWSLNRDATTQVIAVLDSGIDAGHPDLSGRLVPGYNSVDGGSTVDETGHGTFIAGVAAAKTHNALGVSGVVWNGRIMPVKVTFNLAGDSRDSDIIRGLDWAVAHGATIVNMSFSGGVDNPALHAAIQRANSKGVLVVAAAGNTGRGEPEYPGAYSEVIGVGATDKTGKLADFSTWGGWVDIAAPGTGIVSTFPRDLYPSGYGISGGTSFSAPLVAGLAALVRTRYPSLTPAQVIGRLKTTARDAGPRGIDPYYGFGLVDAYAALGGTLGGDLGTASPDANEVPDRATPLTLPGSTSGSIAIEGDLDWYRFDLDAAKSVTIDLNAPAAEGDQNLRATFAVFGTDLKLIAATEAQIPAEDLTLTVPLEAGRHYVAVKNLNGAAATRAHTITLAEATGGTALVGEQEWVRNLSPADFAGGVALSVNPTVRFQREIDPASLQSGIRLIQNRSYSSVPGVVTYDATTRTATFDPTSPLQDGTPYRLIVDGVRDTGGATFSEGYSSTFQTVNVAPPAVTGFDATGGYGTASVKWNVPALGDPGQIIVRRNTGNNPPTSPTTGTPVYAGTGSSAAVSGLAAGTTYTFRAWVKDRSGLLSAPVDTRLIGTRLTAAVSPTSVTYGGSTRIGGKAVRADNGAALAGVPLTLYRKQKGATAWQAVTTQTTTSAGAVSYLHKPVWGQDYQWGHNGSADLLGSRSASAAVGVRPVVTANVSKTTFALGGSVLIYGSVTPAHPGQAVYLQRYVGGKWTHATAVKLTGSSTYMFTIKPTARGTYAYRVAKPGDVDHLTTTSPMRTFKVT